MKAKTLLKTTGPDDPRWHEARKLGFGGSEIATLAGQNPWETPYVCLARKLGHLPEKEDTMPMRVGRKLEPVVAKWWAEENPDYKVRKVNAILQHPKVPYALATLDRLAVKPRVEEAVLECKTGNERYLKEWEEGVPTHYQLQTLWYLFVTNLDQAFVAALIGQHYIQHLVERDPEIEQYLVEIAAQYWELLQRGELPDPDETTACSEAIAARYNKPEPVSVILPAEAEELCSRLRWYKDTKTTADESIRFLENKLKALIGNAEVAYLPGQTDPAVTWKGGETKRFDSKRFKVEHPELYQQFVNLSVGRRFLLKGE
jgi:putative phage-type endonuclease